MAAHVLRGTKQQIARDLAQMRMTRSHEVQSGIAMDGCNENL